MLFEVAIISVPTKKEIEDGKKEELLFGPSPVLAKDAQTAVYNILRNPANAEMDLDKVSILVRPFA